MENSRNKQFRSLKLCAILSSVMKPCPIPLHPTWDMSHSFVQRILPVTHLATDLFQPVMYPSAYVQQALTSHNNGPKAQDSNAASSNILTVPNL